MGKVGIESVFWPDPPKTLYFEKRANGVILNCQIEVDGEHASVQGSDEEICCLFEYGADSERMATEYLKRLGYVRADDWTLPPPM